MDSPRIIGLNGYAGAGKDTAAAVLLARGWMRWAFADVLKALAYDLGWSGRKDAAGRKFLEDLGRHTRQRLGSHVWVNAVRANLAAHPDAYHVITDMRYPNEAEMVRDLGGITVRILRPGTEPGGPSDMLLAREGGFDHAIVNGGTVTDLHVAMLDVAEPRGHDKGDELGLGVLGSPSRRQGTPPKSPRDARRSTPRVLDPGSGVPDVRNPA